MAERVFRDLRRFRAILLCPNRSWVTGYTDLCVGFADDAGSDPRNMVAVDVALQIMLQLM